MLCQPLSRRQYLVTQIAFALAALACITIAGLAGTLLGVRIERLEPFAAGRLLRLGSNFFLLLCSWYAITLAVSAAGREAGRVARVVLVVALLSYIGQVIGRVWPAAGFVLPWTLHDYFAPQTLLLGTASAVRPLLTLLAVTGTGLALAGWQFQRRDLP